MSTSKNSQLIEIPIPKTLLHWEFQFDLETKMVSDIVPVLNKEVDDWFTENKISYTFSKRENEAANIIVYSAGIEMFEDTCIVLDSLSDAVIFRLRWL